ncbi:MAG: O-antigen polymerase [Solibacillus sp.]
MEKKSYNNTIILLVFLFSSPYIMFLNNIILIPNLYKICTFLLLGALFLNNDFKINKKVLWIFAFGSFYFYISIIFNSEFTSDISSFYIGFLNFGVITLLFLSYPINFDLFLSSAYKLSVLNLPFICMNFFYFETINYMTFGANMLFSLTFIMVNIVLKRGVIDILIVVTMSCVVIIFANRSSSLATIIMIIYLYINLGQNNLLKIIKLFVLGGGAISIYLNLNALLLNAIQLIDRLGLQSYAISKLKMTLEQGVLAASSGRDTLVQVTWEIINKENFMPIAYGNLKNYSEHIYPHNIILELIMNFGIVGVFVFLISTGWIVYKIFIIRNVPLKHTVTLIFILIFIRLQFSGSYWMESYLWFLIGFILFNSKNTINQKRRFQNYDLIKR